MYSSLPIKSLLFRPSVNYHCIFFSNPPWLAMTKITVPEKSRYTSTKLIIDHLKLDNEGRRGDDSLSTFM